jgi:hypothetical protein
MIAPPFPDLPDEERHYRTAKPVMIINLYGISASEK